MKKSERTKQLMIQATIALIDETNSTDFTISDIAKKADIAVGLINYHYASKQALLIDAVRSYVEERIQADNVFMLQEDLTPVELLAASFKSYADFLVKHSLISRLHIQYSLEGAINGDTFKEAAAYYVPIVRGIDSTLDNARIEIILKMIVSTIQFTFLGTSIMPEERERDFLQKEYRDSMIDRMIELTLNNKKGGKK